MESIIRKLVARPRRSILVVGLALLIVGNWILPITDRDEARFAEASREMLQRGDYIVPWFNGQWRFDKPILIYWCQSAAYRFLGENGFAARLPSALFTTGTALLLVYWGRKAANDLTGVMAGAMFITGLHVAMIGRIATADMAMIFFFTLAVFCGWEAAARCRWNMEDRRWKMEHRISNAEHPTSSAERATAPVGTEATDLSSTKTGGRIWWMIFYVALALGFLTKGPVALLPFGGVVLARALRPVSFRLPWIETIAGLLLTVVLVACWGIPALAQTHGQFWAVGIGEHVINRSVSVNDSHGLTGWGNFVLLLPLYFLTFFVSFLPWSTRVPASLRRWWQERERDDLGWYLLVQALIVFVVFSLVRTKLPHYTMPAFPCLALWLALQLRSDATSFAWFQTRFVAMVVIIPVFVLALAITARNRTLTETLWKAVRPEVRPETKVGCFGYVEPSLVWTFRSVITNTVVLGDEKNANDFLTNQPPFILVLPTQDVASLSNTNGLRIEVHGLDMVRFEDRDLTAIVRLAPSPLNR